MVQEERQRTRERSESEVESTSSVQMEMPLEQIIEAERRVELRDRAIIETDTLGMTEICQVTIKSFVTVGRFEIFEN